MPVDIDFGFKRNDPRDNIRNNFKDPSRVKEPLQKSLSGLSNVHGSEEKKFWMRGKDKPSKENQYVHLREGSEYRERFFVRQALNTVFKVFRNCVKGMRGNLYREEVEKDERMELGMGGAKGSKRIAEVNESQLLGKNKSGKNLQADGLCMMTTEEAEMLIKRCRLLKIQRNLALAGLAVCTIILVTKMIGVI